MKKGVITTEERDAIVIAKYDITNSSDITETLENLVLKIKIIIFKKLISKLGQVLNNPKEES